MTLARPSETELIRCRETLRQAVLAAGALQLSGAASVQVERKGQAQGEIDIVTDVDRRCEARVLELLRERHPQHAVLSEEDAGGRAFEPGGGPLWILDPLDGTKNYAHGIPRFACALALVWDRDPLLGAIYDPSADELFLAEAGQGATRNGTLLAVASRPLERSLVASALTVRRRPSPQQALRLARVLPAVEGIRLGGCATLDLCDVARGRLDAYFEEGLDPWDTAAGALLVREAKGLVTTFNGEPHDPFGSETLASSAILSGPLRALIASSPADAS